jgi:hypothetical protein
MRLDVRIASPIVPAKGSFASLDTNSTTNHEKATMPTSIITVTTATATTQLYPHARGPQNAPPTRGASMGVTIVDGSDRGRERGDITLRPQSVCARTMDDWIGQPSQRIQRPPRRAFPHICHKFSVLNSFLAGCQERSTIHP